MKASDEEADKAGKELDEVRTVVQCLYLGYELDELGAVVYYLYLGNELDEVRTAVYCLYLGIVLTIYTTSGKAILGIQTISLGHSTYHLYYQRKSEFRA